MKKSLSLLFLMLVAGCASTNSVRQGDSIDKTKAYAIVDTKFAYSQARKAKAQHLAYCTPSGSVFCSASYVLDPASDVHVFPVAVGDEFRINTIGVEKADDIFVASAGLKPPAPGLYYYGSVVFNAKEYHGRLVEVNGFPFGPTMESGEERRNRILQELKKTYPDLLNAFNGNVMLLESGTK